MKWKRQRTAAGTANQETGRSTAELRVAMLTEGTYPFVDGGVSTWCHSLCRQLADVEFSVYAVTGNTDAAVLYPPTPNRTAVVQIPQWGTEDIVEYVQPRMGGRAFLRRKLATARRPSLTRFLRLFSRLVDLVLWPDRTSHDDVATVVALHRYFQEYDYTSAFRARETWECFRDRCLRYRRINPEACWREDPSVLDLTVGLAWLHNLLMPLALPLPDADLMHATVASVIGLTGLIAQQERGTPFVLTEHGVFLRERYISVSRERLPWFLKALLIGLASVTSRLCYAGADIVAPVCSFNTRWEERLGVASERLRIIYNGIDAGLFLPAPKPPETAARPTAVAAARVSAIKDILTMIRAAAIARRELPDLLVRVYGSLNADPAYVERCRALIAELGIESTFELAGFHARPSDLYNEGDISVLSSVTEGFPYTVLESMACERPVVATDVGGVREALDGCGVVVPPRDPAALARGMVELLRDPARQRELGRRSRGRVLERYRIEHTAAQYLELYRDAMGGSGRPPAPRLKAQHAA